jgi:hypothetical protein
VGYGPTQPSMGTAQINLTHPSPSFLRDFNPFRLPGVRQKLSRKCTRQAGWRKNIRFQGENVENKAILPVVKKQPALTKRNKSFLMHLANGRPTLEAYKLAGFKGEPHAAYELRSKLRSVLGHMLEARGIDRQDLMIQAKQLADLPLDPQIQSVTIKQKVDILRLYDKILAGVDEAKPVISPVNFNFGDVTLEQAPTKPGQDGSVVDSTASDLSDQAQVDTILPPPGV